MRYLNVVELMIINEEIIGGRSQLRDVDLLEAAVERPRSSAFGQDAFAPLDAATDGHVLAVGGEVEVRDHGGGVVGEDGAGFDPQRPASTDRAVEDLVHREASPDSKAPRKIAMPNREAAPRRHRPRGQRR